MANAIRLGLPTQSCPVAPEPLGTGGARALPLLELAGHGGAQIEQERLSGWAPSL